MCPGLWSKGFWERCVDEDDDDDVGDDDDDDNIGGDHDEALKECSQACVFERGIMMNYDADVGSNFGPPEKFPP